jgi:hypothetical protein
MIERLMMMDNGSGDNKAVNVCETCSKTQKIPTFVGHFHVYQIGLLFICLFLPQVTKKTFRFGSLALYLAIPTCA